MQKNSENTQNLNLDDLKNFEDSEYSEDSEHYEDSEDSEDYEDSEDFEDSQDSEVIEERFKKLLAIKKLLENKESKTDYEDLKKIFIDDRFFIKDILTIIELCKNYNGYVFLDLCFVKHNINFNHDYLHSYITGNKSIFNKELIILLKEPNEIINFSSVVDKFRKVSKTIEQMKKYHFARRSFFYENFNIKQSHKIMYNKCICKDITTETDSYLISLIGMNYKLRQKFKDRDPYAEYSSEMFYEVVIEKEIENKVYSLGWGS
jgi:hypothetical protein